MTRLRYATIRLDQDVALRDVAGADGYLFAREGAGRAGRGVAGRFDRSEVADVLAGATRVGAGDEGASGPVAFGALPFLPTAPAELVVPALTVGRRTNGTRWATTVTADGSTPPDPAEMLAATLAENPYRPDPGPGRFEVSSSRPPREWVEAVENAAGRIRAGELDKVVLAREVVIEADGPIPIATVLLRLAQSHPSCFLYLVDGFCGASPELLVARSGDVVQAQPMAGTAPRRGDPVADARLAANLLASPTYRHEHQVTIDAVHDGLLAFCSYVDWEPEPSVVALANVQHLATTVEGRLSHPPAPILELVAALHPTPAVCGRPLDSALALIAELEDLDRGPYAGAVGWVDGCGDGRWAVAIRGASIAGNTARVVAGNGIVGDSDPPTELVETRAKLQAVLSAVVRP